MVHHNENIKPCWWGSHVWQTIYFVVAVYPENPSQQKIESICNFFKGLKNLLPCEGCQESYSIFSSEPDTDANCMENFKTRDSLILFVHNLRNKVNGKLTHEYNISLEYFKKKLKYMVMSESNIYDGKVCEMIEVPFIPKELEKKAIAYLKKKTTYNPTQTVKILSLMNDFMKNPTFDYNDKGFRFAYKRNKKCRKIISKINNKMSEGNYNLVESFLIYDKKLHESLLFLGCVIINKDNLADIFDDKINLKK